MHWVVHDMHYLVLLMHHLITDDRLETQQRVPIRLSITGFVHTRFPADQATGFQLVDDGNHFPAREAKALGNRLIGRIAALVGMIGEAGQRGVNRNAKGSNDRTIFVHEGIVGPKPA
jgi:hypothetical protein